MKTGTGIRVRLTMTASLVASVLTSAGASIGSSAFADGPFLLLPTATPLPPDHVPTRFATADLDRDGDLDVVVTGRNEDGIAAVLWNDGTGSFPVTTTVETGGQTDWVEIGDLDGDGRDDLVFAVRSLRGRLAVLRGRGDGGFEEAEEIELGREPRAVLLRDFDGDGDLDLAGLNHREPIVEILLNDGAGSFVAAPVVVIGGASVGITYPQAMDAVDLDGDEDLDLVVVCTGSSRVAIVRNHGDGTFGIPEAWRPPRVEDEVGGISAVAVGDVDGDGDPDLVAPLILLGEYSHAGLFMNEATPNEVRLGRDFAAPSIDGGGYAFAIATGDLDGDGDPDIVTGHAIPGPLTALDNRTVPVDRGGDGVPTFEPPQVVAIDNFFRHVATVDIDGDCDLDVLAVDLVSNALLVLDNLTPQENGCGDGTPRLPSSRTLRPVTARASSSSIDPESIGDLNGDGRRTAADLALWLDRVGTGSAEGMRR